MYDKTPPTTLEVREYLRIGTAANEVAVSIRMHAAPTPFDVPSEDGIVYVTRVVLTFDLDVDEMHRTLRRRARRRKAPQGPMPGQLEIM